MLVFFAAEKSGFLDTHQSERHSEHNPSHPEKSPSGPYPSTGFQDYATGFQGILPAPSIA
jgi:hypothetical protein